MNIPLRTFVHTRPLLVCLTYLASRLAPPGSQTSLFGLISMPVIYFPFALIAPEHRVRQRLHSVSVSAGDPRVSRAYSATDDGCENEQGQGPDPATIAAVYRRKIMAAAMEGANDGAEASGSSSD